MSQKNTDAARSPWRQILFSFATSFFLALLVWPLWDEYRISYLLTSWLLIFFLILSFFVFIEDSNETDREVYTDYSQYIDGEIVDNEIKYCWNGMLSLDMRLTLNYRYSVKGNTYSGVYCVDIGGKRKALDRLRKHCEAFFHVGKNVRVYYIPGRPERSILFKGLPMILDAPDTYRRATGD